MRSWAVQDAKARFSEFLGACITEGPQVVTRRGEEQAVLVPMAEWKRLGAKGQITLKDALLMDLARGDLDIPPRSEMQLPRSVDFDE